MASQPPQRFPTQPSPQPQPSSSSTSFDATASGQHRRSSIPQSTSSEDSQTVILNHPSSSETSPNPSSSHQTQHTPRPKPQSNPSIKEPRKCWICFGDETEDSPTSSEWRSPCPCALTAHEDCLLDWVADLEAPEKRKASSKIECPQCKASITVARPRSPIIQCVRGIDVAREKLLFPCVLLTLAGTVLTGFWMHGFSTIYLIFGSEDAERLLGIDNGIPLSSNWGLVLPLIPTGLIASRTTYADNIFPIVPVLYFATHASRREGPLWPPSVAFTVATLPYLRAVYYELYNRIFASKEKAWRRVVQPRANEDGDGANEGQQQDPDDGDDNAGGMQLELDFQVEIIDEERAEEHQHQEEQPAGDVPAQNQGQAGVDQPQAPAPNVPHVHAHNQALGQQGGLPDLVINMVALAHKVIGALMFPTISATTGLLLKAVLPKKWTVPPGSSDRYPTGFLQSHFGRSIAGGCLFVALKDATLLYAKYRLAQDHKQRRIVDYVAKKEKQGTTSGL